MRYIIAVFSTRNAALSFYEALRQHNIYAAVMNTPREVSTSCGVSVKFNQQYLMKVRNFAMKYNSFVAFYGVEEIGYKHKITLL